MYLTEKPDETCEDEWRENPKGVLGFRFEVGESNLCTCRHHHQRQSDRLEQYDAAEQGLRGHLGFFFLPGLSSQHHHDEDGNQGENSKDD